MTLVFQGCLSSSCIVIHNRERPARLTSISKSQAIESEKSAAVTISYSIGDLIFSPLDEKLLYKYDLNYDENNFSPHVRYNAFGNQGQMTFEVERCERRWGRFGNKRKGNKLDFQITPAIPLDLKLVTGASDSQIDLSKLKLSSLNLKAGVGNTRITASAPNPTVCQRIDIKAGVGELRAVGLGNTNFEHLSIKSGVGEAYLDLTGEWKHNADIEIKTGIGHVTIILPRELGVELQGKRNFLSSIHLDSFHKSGAVYLSDNFDSAKYHVRIRVRTGIGSLAIKWA